MPPISNSYEIVCKSLYFPVSLQGSLLSLITFLQQFGVLSRFFASRRRTGKGRVIKENRDNICPKITKRPVFIAPAVLPVDMKIPRKHWVYAGFFWRRGRDSNPRGIAPKLISSQPRYDHFDTSPCMLNLLLKMRKAGFRFLVCLFSLSFIFESSLCSCRYNFE